MAYSRTIQPANRAATLAVVAALHVGVLYAVVKGLSVVFVPTIDPPPISATNTPADEPTTRPEPTTRQRDTHPLTTPTPDPLGPITQIPLDPIPLKQGGETIGTGPEILPRPTLPTPEPLPIRPPRPMGSPGQWISDADYPAPDLRMGHAGRVGFTLEVSASGRVTGCTVTASSGYPSLDQATCNLLTRRARFQPGADGTGQPSAGTYAGAVRWQIPAG